MNVATKPKYSFVVDERPAHLGGGWKLTLLDDGLEAGGGIYPASTEEESADAYNDAVEFGQTWLDTRPADAMPTLEFEPRCSICVDAGKTCGQPCVCTLGSQVHPNMAQLSIRLDTMPAEAHAAGEVHPDDVAVDRFAEAMKAKLAASRTKGRGGWNDPEQCSANRLRMMLRAHIGKGDPVDVGNFAMMLHQRGERTALPSDPDLMAALEQASKTGARAAELPDGDVVFTNYGEQPEDSTHLECTACGGSGHIDDQRSIDGKADATMDAATVDAHLDAVLRASGSALRYYSMPKSLDDMRAAMRAAMTRTTAVSGGAA